jgi:DNA-binding MarR family transcriptional regulator
MAVITASPRRKWSVKALAEATGLGLQTVRGSLERLVEKGFVDRIPCPECDAAKSFVFFLSKKAVRMGAVSSGVRS